MVEQNHPSSVSPEDATNTKMQTPIRAADPSGSLERQDPRGVHSRTAPDELGWVIEKYINSELHYWEGRAATSWTPVHTEAVRFAREEDGARILAWILDSNGRVVQHRWNYPAPLRIGESVTVTVGTVNDLAAQYPLVEASAVSAAPQGSGWQPIATAARIAALAVLMRMEADCHEDEAYNALRQWADKLDKALAGHEPIPPAVSRPSGSEERG